mmetsp:Transcript_79634/g.200334  ORF Transcript_79634/g.200334 Transcript_79634/m.200334 type:complete len:303 (+) Transcript_79634:75-983(+)
MARKIWIARASLTCAWRVAWLQGALLSTMWWRYFQNLRLLPCIALIFPGSCMHCSSLPRERSWGKRTYTRRSSLHMLPSRADAARTLPQWLGKRPAIICLSVSRAPRHLAPSVQLLVVSTVQTRRLLVSPWCRNCDYLPSAPLHQCECFLRWRALFLSLLCPVPPWRARTRPSIGAQPVFCSRAGLAHFPWTNSQFKVQIRRCYLFVRSSSTAASRDHLMGPSQKCLKLRAGLILQSSAWHLAPHCSISSGGFPHDHLLLHLPCSSQCRQVRSIRRGKKPLCQHHARPTAAACKRTTIRHHR